MSKDTRRSLSRREVLQVATGTAAVTTLAGPARGQTPGVPAPQGDTMIGVPFERRDVVRVGLVGCGGRGQSHIDDLLGIEKVEIRAVCDIVAGKVETARDKVTKAGHAAPEGYAKSERDYERLCQRDDLDVVYVATPWNWHVRMAVAAMENGHHAAVEVPAVTTLEDCWRLVDVSERTRRHCVILENCCYGWSERFVLNMVRAGLLGDLLHAECAYIHDLRKILFFEIPGEGEWRRYEHWRRNGNLYPTHGLGPVALYFDINRGDRFARLVSMSSPSLGLQEYRDRAVPPGDPRRMETYACGDMNTSLIQTARGRTIALQHDTVSPRPYSRINLVSGTKGTFAGYPDRLFLDGEGDHEEWQTIERDPGKRKAGGVEDRFEDDLWRKLRETASGGGHGGMDYIMSWRLVQCLREGLVPDMDVYDAAAWSAPGPLSEESVARGSSAVDFPDFTRGRWGERRS